MNSDSEYSLDLDVIHTKIGVSEYITKKDTGDNT